MTSSALWLRRTRHFSWPSLQRCASAAAVPLTNPVETSSPAEGTRPPPEGVKISKVNSYTVASLENHSFFSNVSVFTRAGSRYETYDEQGLTHLLRNCAFLGNDTCSSFSISRETDVMGATLQATTTREHLVYSSSFLRGNVDHVMKILGAVVTSPDFKPWEVSDRLYTLSCDLARAESSPTSVVLEGLHQVAYRTALCNPLYCPQRNISKFTNEDLQLFTKDHFNPETTIVVGVGVKHDELVRCVQDSFSSESARVDTPSTQAEYVGGSELRIPSNSDLTYAAVVCKGASRKGANLLAAGVLQHILGAESQGHVKWGAPSTSVRLAKAGALVTDSSFSAEALNLNYSDVGLFGINVISEPSDIGKLLKATMKEFSQVAVGKVSDDELSAAKNKLKTRYLMSTETHSGLVEDIANQIDIEGSYSPISDTLEKVDKITKADIVKFAQDVFSTKASYVSHGNLANAPRLDQLLAELAIK